MTSVTKQMELFDSLSIYEGADVEYKGARGGLPRDLWHTYSAFANTQGGTICLGITQQGDRLDVHGLEDADKLLTDFWNTINNPSKVCRNILSHNDVTTIPIAGGMRKVIVIEVHRAGRHERPVYLGSDPFKGTFRRNFEGDYLCREDEVRRMFADRSDEPSDSRILGGFSLSDLDPDSLKQFRNRWISRDPEHAWLREDDLGLLEKLGGWRRDRRTGEEGITVAALLMFGRTETVVAPEAIPNFHVDYRERLSDDPNVRWTDRLTSDGTWEANLFQFYQRVMQKISTGAGIRVPFQRNSEGYRQSWTPIHEALQEALVNALIHADHFGQGGIVIDRYMDRFEFSNPGTLLVARDQILRGGVSECRNKCLQKMFQMLGVGDKAGSGVDKIRSSWAAQHWRSPSLQETQRPDRVRLLLPMVSLLPEGVMATLRTLFGDEISSLNTDEIHTVVTAATEDSVSNQRLQEMLPLHRVEITKLLQGLVRQGFLSSRGVGRGTKYVLGAPRSHSILTNGIPSELDSEAGEAISDLSGASDVSSPDKNPNSPAKESNSPAKESNSPAKEVATTDPGLLEISRAVRESARSTPEQVTQTILQLCSGRFLSLKEISVLLARKPSALRDEYVSKLVRSGRLELRFPQIINHPKQAYRTASSARS